MYNFSQKKENGFQLLLEGRQELQDRIGAIDLHRRLHLHHNQQTQCHYIFLLELIIQTHLVLLGHQELIATKHTTRIYSTHLTLEGSLSHL